MFFLIQLIFFINVNCFTLIKPSLQIRNIIRYGLYEVSPINTIIYYDLDKTQKINIQNNINDDRFIINNDLIYVSLHNINESGNIITRFIIFLYVHDKLNNLYGQYILESKDYKKFDNYNFCSYYELNSIFYCNFSYHKYYLDNINYNTDISFDFIYKNETNTYLRNVGTSNKISYIPTYLYTSELRYKNMSWKKSNKIIYYESSFYYD
jgi:hypothetical protein